MSSTQDHAASVSAPAPGASRAMPVELRLRRTQWVGRMVLYSLTLFLLCLALTVLGLAGWLMFPVRADGGYELGLRWLLMVTFGLAGVVFINLFILHRRLVPPLDFVYTPLRGARVHVALTAYNDEACIAQAVADFKSNPGLHKLIVVENNSRDRTRALAQEAGADLVVTEMTPGYGSCCMRALAEAAQGLADDDVVVLCEGDQTFAAADVQKFLAYLENCDLVLGTRATQELRMTHTQMDWLLNPGNQIVAKLIQARFWGTRLTDCGCTYRAIRAGAYRRLAPHLTVLGNHFSPHMYIEALQLGQRVIEIPVTFSARGGISKGVGSNKVKATRVALAMLGLLYRA